MIRRVWGLIFISLVCLPLVSCSREEPPPPAATQVKEEDSSGDLVIVSTNDFHAALDRAEGLASVIRKLRSRYGKRMIYLDAGDQFQGSLEGNFSKGKAIVEIFNLIGVQASAIGNHEFDYGPNVPDRIWVKPGEDGMGALKERVKQAKYPVLSANIVLQPYVSCQIESGNCNALGQTTVFPPRLTLDAEGQKVCIIGATTPMTKHITNPDYLKGTDIVDLEPVVRAEADSFQKNGNCDWTILLVHEGVRYEMDGKTLKDTGLTSLLRALPPQTVDAVIGGHSHIRVQEVINKTPVIQAAKGGRYVGVLHLSKKDGKKTFRFDPFVDVPDTAVAFDITRQMTLYREIALDMKRKVHGATTAPFPLEKTSEFALGNLVADCLLYGGKQNGGADVSLINSGAIRNSLPKGTITYDHLFQLMPFQDSLVVATLTGAELQELLEIAFSGVLGIPSVSGLQVKMIRVPLNQSGNWDRDLDGDGKKEEWERNLVREVKDSNGQLLDPKKMYRVATIDFLVNGGDYQDEVYDQVPPERIHVFSSIMIRDVIIQYFKNKSPLDPSKYYSPNHPRVITIAP